jgi:hypothetical protein
VSAGSRALWIALAAVIRRLVSDAMRKLGL